MKEDHTFICDANEATASVAYRLSELIAIYPITPSSPMAEYCDEWALQEKKNLWGFIPEIFEMQSEGGVAGAIHGLLQGGSLATTFTASQGLLLMIPNMYKIAGELSSFCMHVTARTLATHALSIFGDHSDLMACRQTGFAFLASNSVQEAQDMACIAHLATLQARVPFLHFFDGFRTSHEINTIVALTDDELKQLVDQEAIERYRRRGLTPDHPTIRGTAQNPDVFFQCREACNTFYLAVPQIVEEIFSKFAQVTGRHYQLFEYEGDPEAENVLILMGSGAETAVETALWLKKHEGMKAGVLKVRLFRPFSLKHFIQVLPETVKTIAVLDRTKEPGALGDPLYQDVVTALNQAKLSGLIPQEFNPYLLAGRYGLGSKEFNPGMVRGIFKYLERIHSKTSTTSCSRPCEKSWTPACYKNEGPFKLSFTIGIHDDVTHNSLDYDESFQLPLPSTFEALFYGLGSDGTVGANKNTIKIIGEETESKAQAYFVYDSKKSGALTISHLRFGEQPIRAPYLITRANFIACSQDSFLERYDILQSAAKDSIFLLNTSVDREHLWESFSPQVQEMILEKQIKVYAINAYAVAQETGMGKRTNTILQTCFFAISGVLPKEDAIKKIKDAIKKTYARKGEHIVQQNFSAVDKTLESLYRLEIPASASVAKNASLDPEHSALHCNDKNMSGNGNACGLCSGQCSRPCSLIQALIQNQGEDLPVSAFPVDGVWPTGTSQLEKRNIAHEIPVWDPEVCIQCNRCVMICSHAAIRSKIYSNKELKQPAPERFRSAPFRSKDLKEVEFVVQVSPEDCTGCGLCLQVCPAKNKQIEGRKALYWASKSEIIAEEKVNYAFFESLPYRSPLVPGSIEDMKAIQFRQPLFEFSGACAGCGETPYIKLLTQLYGDRLLLANATGCTSIYGGNLPTTPYTFNEEGRGPAWANSLFEDNAEFGLGIYLSAQKKTQMARALLEQNASILDEKLIHKIITTKLEDSQALKEQRQNIEELKQLLVQKLQSRQGHYLATLYSLVDFLVPKTLWIVGGDGWAYDIGYGGLDHVLASGQRVRVLVLDTEVYSNTGGQQSKSTPIGALAKFASAGKSLPKKDIGWLAMSYENIYVAQIALGANPRQALQAFTEAESFEGPSLIIAYSHCIAHGYDLMYGVSQQELAVNSGYWPLFRFDPRRYETGESALILDSGEPKVALHQYFERETRFRALERQNPQRAEKLLAIAQKNIRNRFKKYQKLVEVYKK